LLPDLESRDLEQAAAVVVLVHRPMLQADKRFLARTQEDETASAGVTVL